MRAALGDLEVGRRPLAGCARPDPASRRGRLGLAGVKCEVQQFVGALNTFGGEDLGDAEFDLLAALITLPARVLRR